MNPTNLAAAYRGLFAETPDEAEASLARTLEGLVERAEGAVQMRDTALRAEAIDAPAPITIPEMVREALESFKRDTENRMISAWTVDQVDEALAALDNAAPAKPATVPPIVREALEKAHAYFFGCRMHVPNSGMPPFADIESLLQSAIAQLHALDNATPAELPAYARVYDEGLSVATEAGYVMIRTTDPEDLTRIATACTALAAIKRREGGTS